MSQNWLFYLIVTSVVVVGFLLLTRRLTRPVLFLLGSMLIVELMLAALSLRNWPLEYRLVPWFIDMISEERNGPTLLAATQLAVLGIFALYHARGLIRRWTWRDAYWLLFGVAFLIMAADEYVQIHEYFPDWKYVYGALGMLLVAATLVTFRRQWPEQRLVLFLIVGGLAVMAAGGIIIEHVVLFRGCFDLVEDCFRLQIFEEFFELLGASLVLAAVIEHTLRQGARSQRRQAARFVAAGTLGWAMLLVGYQYLLPALQVRWLATPVKVEYLDGQLELVGYRLPNKPLTPDAGSLPVTLYWRARERQHDEYGMSMHLEEFPDLVNVTQTDIPMSSPPATAWLPGQIVPQVVEIPVPPDIEAPRDYWLLLTIWTRPWYDFNYLPITQADRELLSSETVILHTVYVSPR